MAHARDRDSEQALEDLAEAVRRFTELVVAAAAPAEVLDRARETVEALSRTLAPHVPHPPPPRYPEFRPKAAELAGVDPIALFFPYDPVVGRFNPLARPGRFAWEPPKAVLEVRFSLPYQGPPGCVHGAVIAALFDQILNLANLLSGTPGPTAQLTVRYRRPTPLGETLRIEGWREAVEGRRIRGRATLHARGVLCAEAEGTFVSVPVERLARFGEAPEP